MKHKLSLIRLRHNEMKNLIGGDAGGSCGSGGIGCCGCGCAWADCGGSSQHDNALANWWKCLGSPQQEPE